jgi:hypothetical protein
MRWVQRMIHGSISKQWKYSAPLIYLPNTVAMTAE